MHCVILPQIKIIKSKEIEKSLIKDIEEIQRSANMYTFDKMIDLVEEKYFESKAIEHTVIESLKDFFSDFRSIWVHTKEKYWFEGAHPFGSSNNQGISVKTEQNNYKTNPEEELSGWKLLWFIRSDAMRETDGQSCKPPIIRSSVHLAGRTTYQIKT